MKRVPFVVGIACFVLALTIFIFASGLRRLYSGLLFVVIGLAMAWNARRDSVEKKVDQRGTGGNPHVKL